jgi:ANTAR domain
VPSPAARPVAWSGGTPAVTVPIGSPSPAMADRGAMVIVSHPGAAQPATELPGLLASARAQAAAARSRSQELQQWTEHVLAEARTARRTSAQARRQRRSAPAGRDLMQQSEHARLLARLETMPVIEQAKAIIISQSHCEPAQAFDLLRRASQRSNVPVRDLAAQIAAKTAQIPSRRMRQISPGDETA